VTRNPHKLSTEKAEKKSPLGRRSRRWENIRMDILKTGHNGVEWIHLAQDSDVFNNGINIRGSIKYWLFLDYMSNY
jgi:hypothetical protein